MTRRKKMAMSSMRIVAIIASVLILYAEADWTSLATYSAERYNPVSRYADNRDMSRRKKDAEDANAQKICEASGLSQTQKELCLQFPGETKYLQLGVRLGKQECKQQLRDRTWNCPTKTDDQGVAFKVKRNTKEQSFGTAIMAAAGMKMLATACSRGELNSCKCDRKTNQAECQSSGIKYGYAWTRQFINVQEHERKVDRSQPSVGASRKNTRRQSRGRKQRRKEEERLLNLYNGEVGRSIARESAKLSCRCHGVSGTCSTKTCSNKIDKFNQVAKNIVKSYEKAQRVRLNPRTQELVHRKNKRIVFVNRWGEIKTPPNPLGKGNGPRLLYTRKPVDFCRLDDKGRYFNSGRECRNDIPDNEDISCNRLCCSYGYMRNTRTVRKKCKCRLGATWEQLICETCEERIDELLCRPAPEEQRKL